MLQFLLSGALAPFTVALALLTGLMALELVLALLGASILAGGAIEAPDVNGPEIDVPEIDLAEIDLAAIDAPEVDLPDLDALEFDVPEIGTHAPEVSGVSSFLGLGRTPFMIWFASALLGFGGTGLVLQSLALSALGSALPVWMAAAVALAGGWGVARGFGGLFARLLPRDETQSVSETQLGRRRGIVTQGTAARGRPAEVRVTDRHGNPHYLRAEPVQDDAQIPQGSTVLVLRDHRLGLYRLLPLE